MSVDATSKVYLLQSKPLFDVKMIWHLNVWRVRFYKMHLSVNRMTSTYGNISRVTGLLCVEFTGHRWIHSPHIGQWRGALMFSLTCAWIHGWVNNCEAGDLWHNPAHYDVTAMRRINHKKPTFETLRYRFISRQWKFSRAKLAIRTDNDGVINSTYTTHPV